MIKMLYLHILQADSIENLTAFCKLIVLNNYKISKKYKKSVLRYIENRTGRVRNFVKCNHIIDIYSGSCFVDFNVNAKAALVFHFTFVNVM